MFEIFNVMLDFWFYDNLLVIGVFDIWFYVGVLLIILFGYVIGMLCVIDSKLCKLIEI